VAVDLMPGVERHLDHVGLARARALARVATQESRIALEVELKHLAASAGNEQAVSTPRSPRHAFDFGSVGHAQLIERV
jgi:hypothetical protein